MQKQKLQQKPGTRTNVMSGTFSVAYREIMNIFWVVTHPWLYTEESQVMSIFNSFMKIAYVLILLKYGSK